MFKKTKTFLVAVALMVCLIPTAGYAATQSVTSSNAFSSMTVSGDATIANLNSAGVSSTESVPSVKVDFSYTEKDSLGNKGYSSLTFTGKVFPITVSSSGLLKFNASAVGISKTIEFDVYADAACKNRIGVLDSLSFSSGTVSDQIFLPNAGTYYLEVNNSYGNYDPPTYIQRAVMTLSFYTNASMNLQSGKWYSLAEANGDVYYKLTMPYKGYLTVYGDQKYSFDITNSKKVIIKSYQYIYESCDKKATYRLAKGTYYFKPSDVNYLTDDIYKVKYTTTKSDTTMKKGKYTSIYPGDDKEVTYLKIKPTATGYLKVYMQSSSVLDETGYVALCNSKKSKITDEEWMWAVSSTNNAKYYGVTKGKTYYLRLTGFDGKARFAYSQYKITEKSGATKKKAVSLKRGKTVKGVIAAGESKADWYKMKFTKARKLRLYTNGKSQGRIKVTVYNKAGKKLDSAYIVSGTSSYDLESYSKFKKGTYYLKVQRDGSKSNGYYTLKWK